MATRAAAHTALRQQARLQQQAVQARPTAAACTAAARRAEQALPPMEQQQQQQQQQVQQAAQAPAQRAQRARWHAQAAQRHRPMAARPRPPLRHRHPPAQRHRRAASCGSWRAASSLASCRGCRVAVQRVSTHEAHMCIGQHMVPDALALRLRRGSRRRRLLRQQRGCCRVRDGRRVVNLRVRRCVSSAPPAAQRSRRSRRTSGASCVRPGFSARNRAAKSRCSVFVHAARTPHVGHAPRSAPAAQQRHTSLRQCGQATSEPSRVTHAKHCGTRVDGRGVSRPARWRLDARRARAHLVQREAHRPARVAARREVAPVVAAGAPGAVAAAARAHEAALRAQRVRALAARAQRLRVAAAARAADKAVQGDQAAAPFPTGRAKKRRRSLRRARQLRAHHRGCVAAPPARASVRTPAADGGRQRICTRLGQRTRRRS